MARRRFDQAATAAPDCPAVIAAKFALLDKEGDSAAAATSLAEAITLARAPANTPAEMRARFELAWLLFQQCKFSGQSGKMPLLRELLSTNAEGLPAGMTMRELLERE